MHRLACTVRSYRLPLSPFPAFPFALKGWAFPSLVLPFRLPWLAGIQNCGDLLPWLASLGWLGWPGFGCLAAGVAWLAWLGFLRALAGRDSELRGPCKIGVCTYCESGLASGIFTGQMKADRYESLLRVSVPCGLRFAFPCDSRGKVNEASLTPAALANWQWVLSHGHKRPIEATLHTFPASKAD